MAKRIRTQAQVVMRMKSQSCFILSTITPQTPSAQRSLVSAQLLLVLVCSSRRLILRTLPQILISSHSNSRVDLHQLLLPVSYTTQNRTLKSLWSPSKYQHRYQLVRWRPMLTRTLVSIRLALPFTTLKLTLKSLLRRRMTLYHQNRRELYSR